MRAEAYLLIIGAAMAAAAIVVLILNRGLATELLAAIALLGSVAVIINTLLELRNRDD
jgi:hypothetical protein